MEKLFTPAAPEEVGISSQDVQALLKEYQEEGLFMHSVLIIRHGKLICEGYYAPFTRDTKHRMYSVSKSFASGAIGLLCDEGRIKLTDKAYTFFPEIPEAEIHPYIKEATIRDLLMMASPHSTTYTLVPGQRFSEKWVEAFFLTPPKRPAGTVFYYDTSASFILDVIVERVTGKPYLDYMKDKMLRELGFSENAWCVQSPDGYSWGGSGVICTPLDLAKFAYVFLKNGNVNGKQLLSETYVREATASQISSNRGGFGGLVAASGYGYQIWRAPENGFAFRGMGDQYAYCLPDKDLLFVCTADNQGKENSEYVIFKSFIDRIVHRAADTPLPENPAAYAALQKELSALSLHVPKGAAHSPLEEKINGVTYALDENPMGFKTVRLTFRGDEGVLCYENARGKKEIPFGLGKYIEGKFPESHYSGKKIGTPKGEGYRCLSAAVWEKENSMLLRTNIVDDYFGNLGISFGFRDDKLGISALKVAEGFMEDYIGLAGGVAIK